MYFSQVRIDPNNADRVLMGGVKMQMTVDAGKTMEGQASLTAHDDVHAIWIDPNNSDHISSATTAASTPRTMARRPGTSTATCRSACSTT